MAITTTNEVSAAVNVLFQTLALRTAEPLAPYYIGSQPAQVQQHNNTFTALWRRIENFTAVTTPLAELTGSVAFPTRTADQASVTDVTATVQKYGNFIYLNEEVDLVNVNEMGSVLSRRMGMNAGQSLNRLQRNVQEDNATAIFGATGSTATDTGGGAAAGITLGDMVNVTNTLNRNDAMKFTPRTEGSQNVGTTPIRASFWGICHVDTEEDIRNLTGFQPAENYAGQTSLAQGEFGISGGIRWISTTEGGIDADSGATITGTATSNGRTTSNVNYDIYNSLVIGMDAVGSLGFGKQHVKEIYRVGDNMPAVTLHAKPKGSAGAADPLDELSSMGWKTWHAGVILNSAWIRVIRHSASKVEV